MTQVPSFGALLRRARLTAGLTQEALAEAAGLSARAVSDLERGLRNSPHRDTVRLLANALNLDASVREALEDAARRPRPAGVLLTPPDASLALAAGSALSPLVGRSRELHALRTALEAALAASGRLVLLAGEPGIGKTRLAEEIASEGRRHGMRVLWGRCWESEGAPPLWPWIEILRGVVAGRPAKMLQGELGQGASWIAELVPELHEAASGATDVPAAPRLGDREGRFRLFDAITVELQGLSRSRPLLVVLEDLHWADRPSLLLLQFLLQHMASSSMLVVGTYRDTEVDPEHPLVEALGSLPREPSFALLHLGGLTVADVGHLIDAFVGKPASAEPPPLAPVLWQATNGNPLFVREELRYLGADTRSPDELQNLGGDAALFGLDLPEGLRNVISRRLSRISKATRHLLGIAAVVGRDFEAAILQRASGLGEAVVDDALDEAQTGRVIEEANRPAGRYRFSHALFREVLYVELPARRRVRLHRQVAEAIEQFDVSDLGTHVSELAYHYGEAQALLGPSKFVEYSLLAGERALRSYAFEDACTQFQRGLGALAGHPVDARQAALLFGLARAQMASLEILQAHEVVANLSRAFDYYAGAGDVDQAVAVAECPVDALPGQPVGAARLVERALALVDPDSHAAGRLLCRYARMAAIEAGNYPAAVDACSRALAIARREHDRWLEIQTLGNGAEADLNYLHFQVGLEKCEQALDLAGRTDELQDTLLPRFFACIILMLLGELQRAAEQTMVLRSQADQLRDRRWIVNALWIDGTVAYYRGDWSTAREATDRGLALAPADPRILWTRISLAHAAGDTVQVNSLMDRLRMSVALSPPCPDFAQATTALVVSLVASSDLAEDTVGPAEATAEAILSFPTATLHIALIAQAALAVMAVRHANAAAAARQYRALQPAAGLLIYEGIASDRLLGLLAHAMGNQTLAAAHFEDALRFCHRAGCLPELVHTCQDFAVLLDEQGTPRAHARATALLKEAVTISRELGIQFS